MNPWVYLLQTLGWCAVGFVAGFLAGRAARDMHRIADAVTEGGAVPASRRRRMWDRLKPSGQFLVALVVVVLGVLTVVQGLIQSAATRRVSQCHAAYANAFADALDARSRASQEAQDALDGLMITIGRLSATPVADEADRARRSEESRKAISDYVTKRAQAKDQQARNPYPPPPRDACPNT